VLYEMSRELMVAKDPVEMSAAAVRHISAVFDSQVAVLIAGQDEVLRPVSFAGTAGLDPLALLHTYDAAFAQAVAARGERRANEAAYLPLVGDRRAGVIIVRSRRPARSVAADHLSLLDAFAAQLAASLQRAWVAEEAEAARMDTDRAQLRNTLLSSISHDLRTPLAAIASAGNLIAQDSGSMNVDRRMILGQLIESKAADMTRLISNMLDLVRMELREGLVRAEWHAIDELVSHSLRVNAARLAGWRVLTNIPDDLPLAFVQATLIVQIFNNLLENVTKYTPVGTTITISATADAECLLVDFSDDGPGLPADPERLFEKFERGHSEHNEGGVGLGLTICRTAARLHGGDVRASRSPNGGARFEVILRVPMRNLSSAELQLSAELS
jgi:two-component system sensor histidine kinase KdpD